MNRYLIAPHTAACVADETTYTHGPAETPTEITVRGRTVQVEMEPAIDGSGPYPYLYNSRGECIGVVRTFGTVTTVVGAPASWTASDRREAVRQLGI